MNLGIHCFNRLFSASEFIIGNASGGGGGGGGGEAYMILVPPALSKILDLQRIYKEFI